MDIALVASDSSIDLNYPLIVVPRAFVSITGYFVFGKSLINTLGPILKMGAQRIFESRQKDYL